MRGETTKSIIEDTVKDAVTNFMYYDRKEDQELPVGAIEESIRSGAVSTDWIVDRFRYWLQNSVER